MQPPSGGSFYGLDHKTEVILNFSEFFFYKVIQLQFETSRARKKFPRDITLQSLSGSYFPEMIIRNQVEDTKKPRYRGFVEVFFH